MKIVKVRYFSGLRDLLKRDEEVYEVEDGTRVVDLLLRHIPSRHGKISENWKKTLFRLEGDSVELDGEGLPALRDYYMVLMNFNLLPKDGLKSVVEDGDLIALSLMVGGG